jgi:serine/threonine-protein kinase HipA
MSFPQYELVNVFLMRDHGKTPVGRLAYKNRRIFFEYDLEFIKTGLMISPYHLPLKPGILTSTDRLFDGLFGVFNDSLPDGWGKLLLDRSLAKQGFNPASLSALDRLCYVGKHGMGALVYEPEVESSSPFFRDNLDELARESLEILEYDGDQFVDHLLSLNASSAGARPKIVVNLKDENWIIKFRASLDPKDIGPIEYAYHLMAKEAGLDVPEAKLFPSIKGPGYFGVKRFDRQKNKFFHMQTMSGLLHVDHREPSLDYETILKTTLWLTKDLRECEKQFRAAVFNVLSHNRDDHAKNFSFLMEQNGIWHVSPAYDLTFSSGPGGEHCTTVMGEGKQPSLEHLLKLASTVDLKEKQALDIIEKVKLAVNHWPEHANQAGVSQNSKKLILSHLKLKI